MSRDQDAIPVQNRVPYPCKTGYLRRRERDRSLVLLSCGSGTEPDKDHPTRSAEISAIVRDVVILAAVAKPTVNSVKKMATSFMVRDLLWG